MHKNIELVDYGRMTLTMVEMPNRCKNGKCVKAEGIHSMRIF
jgi:hypothetical protein